MRWVWAVALALAVGPGARAESIDPAEAWRPMNAFIGNWKGTRAATEGTVKVKRVCAGASTNRHLEITDAVGGHAKGVVRGIVSFDPEKQRLVLHDFGTDGSAADPVLDEVESVDGKLVFASPESDPTRIRITFERTGTNSFTERVERSSGAAPFAVVTETRFVRAD